MDSLDRLAGKFMLYMQEKHHNKLREMKAQTSGAISRLPPAANFQDHPQVIDALYSIQTTPFRSSFLSRLHGTVTQPLGVLAMDWVTASPWMKLMGDIREHYALAQYVLLHVSCPSLIYLHYTFLR